ncbi:MAG TPA: hypothetical protein VFS36_00945 [Chitinophagaceae bacterium]|nr:hypothetical protein [Chitinophagaceae bacterium]
MKKIISILAAVFVVCHLSAQTDTLGKKKKPVPNIAIILTTKGIRTKGWLYQVNDSQVVLYKGKAGNMVKLPAGKKDLSLLNEIQATQIEQISFKKRNNATKGALIGLGAGVLLGVVTGLIEGSDKVYPYPNPSPSTDPYGLGTAIETFAIGLNNVFALTAGQKAVLYGAGLGSIGCITGAIIGAVAKKKFVIQGKKEKFRDLQGELMRRLVIRN